MTKTYPHIFVSNTPEEINKKYRFKNHHELQAKLIEICNNWFEYLVLYRNNSQLLYNNKMPWEHSERALVSTLAASIARSCQQAMILEELPVSKYKYTTSMNNHNEKESYNGRCDLWVTNLISEKDKEPFTFFLEAKWFGTPRRINENAKLISNKGIGMVFKDFAKIQTDGKITQISKFKSSVHHYAISMLTVPVLLSGKNAEEDLAEIKDMLGGIFNNEKAHKFKTTKKEEKNKILNRYPTVGLIINPTEKHPGMITILTVLAKGMGIDEGVRETGGRS